MEFLEGTRVINIFLFFALFQDGGETSLKNCSIVDFAVVC